MLNDIEKDLVEELKNPDFAKSYGSECAKSEFGMAILQARTEAGITQKELAEKLQVSQPYIARLESGEANPTLGTAGKILAVLGYKASVSIENLTPGVDSYQQQCLKDGTKKPEVQSLLV